MENELVKSELFLSEKLENNPFLAPLENENQVDFIKQKYHS